MLNSQSLIASKTIKNLSKLNEDNNILGVITQSFNWK